MARFHVGRASAAAAAATDAATPTQQRRPRLRTQSDDQNNRRPEQIHVGSGHQGSSPISSVSSPSLYHDAAASAVPAQQQQQQTHSSGSTPRRSRFNSREIPRTYSGLYGGADDMVPFEINRSKAAGISAPVFLCTYLTLVLAVHLVVVLFATAGEPVQVPASRRHDLHSVIGNLNSWTVTNAIHLVVTLIYIHWLKGSFVYDEQGEMNAMTVWEQLEAAGDTVHVRRTLLVVPTVLTYAAVLTADFEATHTAINVVFWCVAMLAKLPFMNGVRIFGINRTVGIDDETEAEQEENDAAADVKNNNKKER
jgi:hypothetical protein